MKQISEFLEKKSQVDLTWKEEAKSRRDNREWLRLSAGIGLAVLRTLRAKNMTQRELATLLECSPQYVSKIVKGSENLTLETICKLEKVLGIRLITSTFSELHS